MAEMYDRKTGPWRGRTCDDCGRLVAARTSVGRVLCTQCHPGDLPFDGDEDDTMTDKIDQSSWPAHLRDDAPYQRCNRCGRKTWSVDDFGAECTMPQKWSAEAGWHGPCGGRFRKTP